ncbi:MAG: hypothetical protein QXO70_02595 [Candidatus Pacearchaeota archaeon]
MDNEKITALLNLIADMRQQEQQRQQQQHKRGRKKGSYNDNIKEIMEFIQQERKEKSFCCLSFEYLKTFGYNNEQIKQALKHLNLTFYKSVFAYKQLTTKKKKVKITDYTKDNEKIKVLSEKEREIGILCRLWNFKTFRVITDIKPTTTAKPSLFLSEQRPLTFKTIQKKIRYELRQQIKNELRREQLNLICNLGTNRLSDLDKWRFFAIR